MMYTTTLRKLRAAHACAERYAVLRKGLGPRYGSDRAIPMVRILDICGIDDVLWVPESAGGLSARDRRLYACDCAERVLLLADDARSKLRAAWDAAWAAARDAARAAAWDAARDAERAWQVERLRQYLAEEVTCTT